MEKFSGNDPFLNNQILNNHPGKKYYFVFFFLFFVIFGSSAVYFFQYQKANNIAPKTLENSVNSSQGKKYAEVPQNKGVKGLVFYYKLDEQNRKTKEKIPLSQIVVSFVRLDDPGYLAQTATNTDGLFQVEIHNGQYTACLDFKKSCLNATVRDNYYDYIELEYPVDLELENKTN